VRDLPGKPDFVFAKARLAVFVDGDFWHGRDWASRKAKLHMGANADYWIEKIEGNIARDRRNRAVLRRQGWRVLRCWESAVIRSPEACGRRVRFSLPI
jgi:DNA mismatch endonuclease (patch repair protein)